MKTVTVKPNQTVFDILVEQYGTCEVLAEFLENNPDLENDPGTDKRAVSGTDFPVRPSPESWQYGTDQHGQPADKDIGNPGNKYGGNNIFKRVTWRGQ